jgi:hypothetical protein
MEQGTVIVCLNIIEGNSFCCRSLDWLLRETYHCYGCPLQTTEHELRMKRLNKIKENK